MTYLIKPNCALKNLGILVDELGLSVHVLSDQCFHTQRTRCLAEGMVSSQPVTDDVYTMEDCINDTVRRQSSIVVKSVGSRRKLPF